MKKVISLALSALLALSLAACGGSNTTTVASRTESSGSSTEAAQTEAPESEETPAAKSEFQEQTIVDNEYCTVILKGTDDGDGMCGYSLKVYLENKTADKTLLFGMDNTSVNGVMVDPLWGATVAPGKKSNETISWLSTSLEKNNIKADDITQVSFTLNVYDKDDLAADEFVDEEFTIYPKGEENASTVEREAQSTDIVLFDNDSCSMTVTGFEHDDICGYTVKAYLVNKTDKDLMFYCDDASINGYLSAVPNTDGSVTLTMTKAKHSEMMAEMKQSIDDNIQKSIGDDGFQSIKEVTYNDDVTEFTVKVDREAFEGSWDGLSALTYAFCGAAYQYYSGVSDPSVVVTYIDADTGETISTSTYPDDYQDLLGDSVTEEDASSD